MKFNLKLVEYNNTATISVYDDLVGFDDDYERPPPRKKTEGEVMWNPFTNKKEIVTEFLDEIDEFTKNQKSLEKSRQRSKRNILTLIRSMDLSNAYFVTLTFDKSKVDRRNFKLCCAKTRNWLQNLRKRDGAENMSFLCVPELHPKSMDAWHMHLIICNAGDFPITDSGHKDLRKRTIYNVDLWKYGFSTAIRIEGEPMTAIKLSHYITKYLTKESAMIAHYKHRYFASRNISKPRISTFHCDTDEQRKSIISGILESGYEAVSKNHYENDYVGIDYIDMVKVQTE